MDRTFLWHFMIPAGIGIAELLLLNWAWHRYYYGDLGKFVSAAIKRRITLPLAIAIPVDLILVSAWWRLQVFAPLMHSPSAVPVPAIGKVLWTIFYTAGGNLAVYQIADGICQKYVAPKLPREPIPGSSRPFVSRGRGGW